ncbi:MAG: hypothetical protein U0X40_08725 [Ferruginibacter sp.]
MNKELILKSDVLDIIFEKRNKDYGAYDLRRYYSGRLGKALAVMLGMAAVFSCFAVLAGKKTHGPVIRISDYEMARVNESKRNEPPREQKHTPVTTKAPQVKLLSHMLITKLVDSTDVIREVTGNVTIGSQNNADGDTNATTLVTPAENTSTGTGTEPVKTTDKTRPVDNPDIMPSFPGGIDALRNFLQRNLQNPRDLEEGEVVSVQVHFVVGYDGKLQAFTDASNTDADFYKEVIRVLRKMPDWIPGKSNGESVAVNYMIPVKFVTQHDE